MTSYEKGRRKEITIIETIHKKYFLSDRKLYIKKIINIIDIEYVLIKLLFRFT